MTYETEHKKLSDAFDLVMDKKHWKNPINKNIKVDDAKAKVVSEAIVYFTGSVPTVTKLANGKTNFRAAGYYLTIGELTMKYKQGDALFVRLLKAGFTVREAMPIADKLDAAQVASNAEQSVNRYSSDVKVAPFELLAGDTDRLKAAGFDTGLTMEDAVYDKALSGDRDAIIAIEAEAELVTVQIVDAFGDYITGNNFDTVAEALLFVKEHE